MLAFEFADLRFGDGHVERWIGMGWPRHVAAGPDPMQELLDWAGSLADESCGVLHHELRTEFRDVPPEPFASVPTEVVVEWNARLPPEPFRQPD